MDLQRNAQMRYIGQFWEVLTEIPFGKLDADSIANISSVFHKEHETEHGVSSPQFAVEFVSIGLTATGQSKRRRQVIDQALSGGDPQIGERQVFFDGDWHRTPVYGGNVLTTKDEIEGPAIIEYPHSVTVLPPNSSATVDGLANLIIDTASSQS
jgi:N-methylhydantoinase A